jgi:tetratricopeptide (TPR) repeat protein
MNLDSIGRELATIWDMANYLQKNLIAWPMAVAVLLATGLARAQCQPVSGPETVPSSKEEGSGIAKPGRPEFYDVPKFTVAGVTDPTNLGGHGSDTIVRTKESLAKDVASLGKETRPGPLPADSAYRAAYERARSYRDAGRYDLARASLRDVLDEDRAGQHFSPQDQAGLHHQLAGVEEQLHHPVEAVREYQRAADLDPSETNLYDWGAELLLHHAPEPATAVFVEGMRLFPHSVRMLTGLGVAWYARGSYDQAAQRLCEASDLDPGDPSPYLFLGKMLTAEAAQPEGLAERLERFARLQPENAQANYYYAVSLWKQRRDPEDSKTWGQMESLLKKAILLDPKLAPAHLQLGILHAERKDFSQAIAEYEKAVESDPGRAEPHYRLAQAYKRVGETQKANLELRLYEQASRDAQEEIERQRHEMQQFVVTSRERTSAPRPPN